MHIEDFVRNPPVFLSVAVQHALTCEENMAATLRALCAEY